VKHSGAAFHLYFSYRSFFEFDLSGARRAGDGLAQKFSEIGIVADHDDGFRFP